MGNILRVKDGNGNWITIPALVGEKGEKGEDGVIGKDGVGIASIKQTTTSTADDGNNVITVTLTDGRTSTFIVQNGSKGSKGDTGATGTFDSSALSNYALKATSNTFDGEQKMLNSSYCPTMNDIAAGIGCSLKNSRACDNQLIVGEVWAPLTAASDGTINMTSTVGEIPFYKANSASGGQFSGKTQMARITASGIYEGSTLLADKYLGKGNSTLGGTITLGSSGGTIGANGYVCGTWLQTKSDNHLSSKAAKVCVQDNGWVYYRTLAELASDLGINSQAASMSADTIRSICK